MIIARVLIIAALIPSAGGCILVPTPSHKSDTFATRQNLSHKSAEQIQVGVTSREQVLLLFGEPDATFDRQRRFVYLWADVTAWWFAAAGNSSAGGEIGEGSALEIDFDPRGIVSRRLVRKPGLADLFTQHVIAGVVYAPPQSLEPPP
jgi:outer membrane protein assembly factor BamE (lipoprotein component of BamABCDE complex)